MSRWFFESTIAELGSTDTDAVLGRLAAENPFPLQQTQRDAWLEQIRVLKAVLSPYDGSVFFEYTVPRMGKRIDAVAIIGAAIFVLEFKVGASTFDSQSVDQVWDYALDLKNFHETSHSRHVAPILIATESDTSPITAVALSCRSDWTFDPICCNEESLPAAIDAVLAMVDGEEISSEAWAGGRYCPTPTIVEAATALYSNHSVEDISRSDAGAINLRRTSQTVAEIIADSRTRSRKSICFVTGVPGAGKTLVGLNVATTHFDKDSELYSVFLSGNGPLVRVLREALTRDRVAKERAQGKRVTKKEIGSEVQMFIQNVHHFRDDCLFDTTRPPIEHVALFDEAQRAWDKEQTVRFMKTKKKRPGFEKSEPDFLISCLDRHDDWAVVVCLVGGGQEINTGEAGIGEWIRAIQASYPSWDVYLSRQLTDSEYGAGRVLQELRGRDNVTYLNDLHLAVSMRSFRAENVSLLVKQILDKDVAGARQTLQSLDRYPIVITRDLSAAKGWLREHARGSERYGIVVSSQAERLRPHAIDVRPQIDPIHWFLNGKDDVRSSYYMEDVATEFHVQGLELDWACVTWDADFRFTEGGWKHRSFRGTRWTRINREARQVYLKNAYRVLLTRARQGMAIVVPPGSSDDPTRLPEFYDPTFEYLAGIGFPVIG